MALCAAHPDRPSTAICSRCDQALCAECTRDLSGRPYCAGCVAELERKLADLKTDAASGTAAMPFGGASATPGYPAGDLAVQDVSLVKPILFALAAGLAGSAVWYFSVVLTDYKLGLIAVGVGWLVGFAAVRGAGGRGGSGLALASVVIALASMLLGEYLIVNHAVAKYLAEENPGMPAIAFIGAAPFFTVYRESLGVMDAVFYAIGAWEAWKQPAAAR